MPYRPSCDLVFSVVIYANLPNSHSTLQNVILIYTFIAKTSDPPVVIEILWEIL